MSNFLKFQCDMHPDPWDCADYVVVKADDGRIGVPLRDGGESMTVLNYCPWCGTKLPKGIKRGETPRQLYDAVN